MEQATASFEDKNKKTKLVYIGLYSLLILIGLSFFFFVLLFKAQQKLVDLGEIRYQSNLLADQLHQSSDDLTRLVRTYVVTGNKKYEQQFWNVLAIRDGKKPRPLHYERPYWDFLSVKDGKPPYPLGKPLSLVELMKEAGFTEREFSLLAEAQKHSDQLVKLEQDAMNAIDRKTAGKPGEIPNDDSEQQAAIRILFGEQYHQAKIGIMQPINLFLGELENRTSKEVSHQASRLQTLLLCEISTFILIVCITVFVMRTSKQYHTGIVSMLNLTVKGRTAELLKSNEIITNEIAERKKIEETLVQSAKLESLGTITAGISHEFNNILNIISGNVQLLKMDYKDHSTLMNSPSVIEKSIKNGTSITDRMYDFTHGDRNTTGLVFADINELITHSVEFTMPRWKSMAQASGINYNMDMEGMKSVSPIICNPLDIKDVFINIINNALDAMPDGGTISFRTWSKDDTVFASISDIGRGMPEEVMKNVFDPFFTTKRPEGTGLGMSTSYSKVVRDGGKIEVDSEEGKGSKFTLQFPSTIKTTGPATTPKPKQRTKGKELSILVVDDEEEICNMLVDYLSRFGHKVKAVDGGHDAIELAKRETFDLVLCDLAMPHVFGYDVIKVFNKLEKRPKIGIITGWGGVLKPMDDEEFKVDFIVRKAFGLSELTDNINDVFGSDSK